MERKDYIINDPMFIAKDGSYHPDVEGVKTANQIYWDSIMWDSIKCLRSNPSYSSLLSVLQDGLSNQLYKDEHKGMKR